MFQGSGSSMVSRTTSAYLPRKAEDREQFDRLLFAFPKAKVQLSWGWGESRKTMGWEPVRYLLTEQGNDAFPLSLQVKSIPLTRMRLGMVPAIPPFVLDGTVAIESFVEALQRVAKKEHLFTVTMVVPFPRTEYRDFATSLVAAGLRPSVLVGPALRSVIVDLKPDEDCLFKSMKYGHRRDARKAMRAGVTVDIASRESEMEAFYGIYSEMCRFKELPALPWEFFASLWRELVAAGRIRLFLVRHNAEILGGTVVACEPQAYLMLFSAHRRSGTDLGASRLLEWEIISDGRRRGLAHYDLGGIPADEGGQRTQDSGVAFWKLGFGGAVCDYVGAFDLAVNPLLYAPFRLTRSGTVYRTIKAVTKRRWI